jgi:hypothetical protein
MEYTEGPWILEENHGKHESAFTIVCNSQQMWLAKVGHPHDNPEITVNNAKLMTAAPEMYEACLGALGILNQNPSEIPKMIDSIRSQIIKALAKAEGR